jgi:hypothetical protein
MFHDGDTSKRIRHFSRGRAASRASETKKKKAASPVYPPRGSCSLLARASQVLSEVSYEMRLNHRGVLNAVWQYTGVPLPLRPRVAQVG